MHDTNEGLHPGASDDQHCAMCRGIRSLEGGIPDAVRTAPPPFGSDVSNGRPERLPF